MKTRYLVCYDITDPRRWRKVYRYLKREGVPVQYSVFMVDVGWTEFQKLKKDLSEMIHPEFDDVRIYPLPRAVREKTLGAGTRLPSDIPLFFD